MGQYNKAVLTTAGEKLIARVLAGEIKLNITKAKTSDFAYPDNADLKRLTDMQGVRQTVCDPETVVFNETIIQTRVLFSNEDIASTYYIHNIGLYAMDGTNEVLFSIVTAEMPDEMPQYNGVASTSYIYNIQNVVQDAPQLNISMNLSGTATIQDVLERVDAIGGDISETVIETLDTVEDKYPVPAEGESVKRFFGKVLKFLRNIRPLTGNINIYVSSTGSDILGDGTSGNPFKTIQHAIDILPKDFNSHSAVITISGGTYNEDIVISGFTGGLFQLILNGNVTIGSITVLNSKIVCTGYGAQTLTIGYLYVAESGRFDSFNNISVVTTGYVNDQPITGGKASIAANRGDIYISGPITLTGNTDVGISIISVSRMYFSTMTGTRFNVGVFISTGSVVTCGATNGMAVSATTPIQQGSGGMFIYANCTQISGLISSGLSCTWGTVAGGYYRNGSAKGVAVIHIGFSITTTAPLTAGQNYTVSGIPPCALAVMVASCSYKAGTNYCYVTNSGNLIFNPLINMSTGSNLIFGGSYITNT